MQTFIFLMIVIIAVCVITTLVILSQNPKGGGLSSTFGGGSGGGQMFGVQRTNQFLDNATWTLAGLIVVLIITANVLMENPYAARKTNIESVPVELPEIQPEAAPSMDVGPATPPAETQE